LPPNRIAQVTFKINVKTKVALPISGEDQIILFQYEKAARILSVFQKSLSINVCGSVI
jgi:hypothetical protein